MLSQVIVAALVIIALMRSDAIVAQQCVSTVTSLPIVAL
jgi:hypothetical protein